MKRTYFNLVVVLAMSCISSSIWATSFILKNNYGAPIEYVERGTNGNPDAYFRNKPKTIADKAEIRVSPEFYLGHYGFCMRTVGGQFQDVTYAFRNMEAEARQRPNQTPVITISHSMNPLYQYYWHLTPSWK